MVGGSCGSWLASDDITAVCLNDRGASGSRASSLLQGFVVAGGNLVGAGLPAMTSLRFGGTTETPMAREQARSYRGLWWLADLVGAGLPAMASLLSGGTTGVPADREQARSYRGLWWLAVILWELACQRWHHRCLAERPGG